MPKDKLLKYIKIKERITIRESRKDLDINNAGKHLKDLYDDRKINRKFENGRYVYIRK